MNNWQNHYSIDEQSPVARHSQQNSNSHIRIKSLENSPVINTNEHFLAANELHYSYTDTAQNVGQSLQYPGYYEEFQNHYTSNAPKNSGEISKKSLLKQIIKNRIQRKTVAVNNQREASPSNYYIPVDIETSSPKHRTPKQQSLGGIQKQSTFRSSSKKVQNMPLYNAETFDLISPILITVDDANFFGAISNDNSKLYSNDKTEGEKGFPDFQSIIDWTCNDHEIMNAECNTKNINLDLSHQIFQELVNSPIHQLEPVNGIGFNAEDKTYNVISPTTSMHDLNLDQGDPYQKLSFETFIANESKIS